jgi:hypothetical protein
MRASPGVAVEELMSIPNLLFKYDAIPTPKTSAVVSTFAERLLLEERERAHQRHLDRAEQISDLNSPEIRIRAWEKLHGLRLPSDPAHPVLDVVAVSTRLTLDQVHEEQRARATRRGPQPAAPALR